jgi:hypothetical protein
MKLLPLSTLLILGILFLNQAKAQEKLSTPHKKNSETGNSWRSKLYPDNWKPGFNDGDERFLHDFSYAGYHQGTKAIPNINSNIIDVTEAPYNADNTGTNDATAAIQSALNDAGLSGGGVVYLPAGTYKVTPGADAALRIKYDNTILRGAGTDSTFIFNSTAKMRQKSIIWMMGNWCTWSKDYGTTSKLRTDILLPTRVIPVQSVKGFKKGDAIILRTNGTEAFIEEHLMSGYWENWSARVMFLRTIDSIDIQNNFIYIDSPTRYFMKIRDNARVYQAKKHIEECGIENLSIGNVQSDKTGWEENDYNISGTGAYDAHASHAIFLKYTQNCWIRNVNTYKPESNSGDFHLVSNCLLIEQSRGVTVDSCFFQKPQYEGGGGNGYMFTLSANDCLIKNSRANDGRHNYDFKFPYSNGNVIMNCIGENSKYASDFHMYLSMSNLFDKTTVDKDFLESTFRPYGGSAIHGYSSTQTVFYNTTGKAYHSGRTYIVDSRQFKHGYVIGTSGKADKVKTTPVTGEIGGYSYNTSPVDFVEGVGKGEDLFPQSLYLDQLQRRVKRDSLGLPKFKVKFNIKNRYDNRPVTDCTIKNFEHEIKTDTAGVAAFDNVNALLVLNFEAAMYHPLTNQQLVIYSDTTLTFYLTPHEFDVTIVVHDKATGETFSGVPVIFNGVTKITNNSGETFFKGYKGEFSYSIKKNSYYNQNGYLTVLSDSTYHFYLTRSEAYIKFVLKHGTTPINKATVILNTDTLITAGLGIAKFKNLPIQKTYNYSVQKNGYEPVSDNLLLTTDTTITISMKYPTNALLTSNNINTTIFPNPANDKLYISGPVQFKSYSVKTILGSTVLRGEFNIKQTINTSRLKPGNYLISLQNDDFIVVKKLIKL